MIVFDIKGKSAMKIRTVHLVGIAIILGISGLVHGMWTNRWYTGPKVLGKDLLAGIDELVGDWQAGEIIPNESGDVPPKTMLSKRRFHSLRGRSPVVVSICSGYSGEVAVHTPDVCYLGAGYKIKTAVVRQVIQTRDGKEAAFWMADFEKSTATGSETVRVRWSWSKDGTWQAPDYPHFSLPERLSCTNSTSITSCRKRMT